MRRRRSGREHILALDPQPLDQAAAWMDRQRALWTARLDALDELLRAEEAQASSDQERKEGPDDH